MKTSWYQPLAYDRWMQTINNPKIATLADYNQWIKAFEVLFHTENRQWPGFYQAVEKLGKMEPEARVERLKKLDADHSRLPLDRLQPLSGN